MRGKPSAMKVTFPALMAALSLIFLYVAFAVPSGSLGFVAVAGLFPAAAVISVGMGAGVLCWAAVSVLGFLLVPDKFVILAFAVLFGLYPVVKSLLERMKKRFPEFILKLLFFNAAFTVIFLLMREALLSSLPAVLSEAWVLYPVGSIVFLLYDYGFSKLISLYIVRVQRLIK